MQGAVLKGHLDSLLLAAVARTPSHGYAIIETLSRLSRGSFDLPEGSVYPALHRLEQNGLLASRWIRAEGRPRRVYRLTPKGRRVLTDRRKQWRGFARAVGWVLGETR